MGMEHASASPPEGSPVIRPPVCRRKARVCALLATLLLAVALAWLRTPAPFLRVLARPYPDADVLVRYQENLRDFPVLLLVTASALMAVAFALAFARPPTCPSRARDAHPLALAAPVQLGLAISLLLVAWWFSERHWLFWNRPLWDCYTLYAEALHTALFHPDEGMLAALVRFVRAYPHSPSPLTPALVALGMLVVHDSTLVMHAVSLAATAGSVVLVVRLGRILAPKLPPWVAATLFLTNAATLRNADFVQLDAGSSFFVLLFFKLLATHLRRGGHRVPWAVAACTAVALFQKTTLFPLLVVPTLLLVHSALRHRRLDGRAFVRTAVVTGLLPTLPFATALLLTGLATNVFRQVELMGVGWNTQDFSLLRFVFATSFLLAPYLPLAVTNRRLGEPLEAGLVLFVILFFASLIAVRGPFWSRYYSLVVGPTLLLALAPLDRLARRWPAVALTVIAAIATVGYAMMSLNIF